MRRRKKNDPLVDKKIFKASIGRCMVCNEPDTDLLDVHRLIPGSKGGRYNRMNSSCICALCHRKVHTGKLEIDRYYMTTQGYKLRIVEDGVERFV